MYWNRAKRKWHVQFRHNYNNMYLGSFDEEEDAARAHDRMANWFELHGVARNNPNGGVHDSSSVKASLNFAYDEYKGEFAELRRMTQEECVQSLKQQGADKWKRPESAADKQLTLVGGEGGGGDGGGGGGGKRKRVRSEPAAGTPLAMVRGGSGGGGGGNGSGGDDEAAARVRASVAEARVQAVDAGRHDAEMQLNAGLSRHCVSHHSPQLGSPFINSNCLTQRGEHERDLPVPHSMQS